MITMITGKIGSGKSLMGLVEIMKLLGQGLCVVSNFTFDERAVDRWLWKKHRRRLVEGQLQFHDFEQEPEFHKSIPFGMMGKPVTVFCDEAQLYYNQADSSRLQSQMMRLVSFLTQSRKCKVDVWFITQYETTVWAQFRHQCLFGYRCRDMRAVTLPFVGKLPIAGLKWSKFDTQSGEIMERGSTPLSRELFGLYDTNQMYDSQMRDLQANARIWEPVPKNAPGKFEEEITLADSCKPEGITEFQWGMKRAKEWLLTH